jgi:hypothetical protein
VDHDSRATQQTRQRCCAVEIPSPIPQFSHALAIDQHDPPDHGCKTENSHFDQQLQKVIMGAVAELIGKETAILRLDDREGAHPKAKDRPVRGHFQSIAVYRGPQAAFRFGLGLTLNAYDVANQAFAAAPRY